MADSRQRILSALKSAPAMRPLPDAPLPPVPMSIPDGPEAWELFRAGLARVRVDLAVAEEPEEVFWALREVAREFGVRKAALWQDLPLPASAVAEALRAEGVEPVYGNEEGEGGVCGAFAHAQLGVTGADLAFVSSGTLLVRAGRLTPRGASLLPPVHLALVPRSALRPSCLALPELLRGFAAQGMPSALHLITGPSSTSDIELTQVLGVHGPTTVRVIGLDFSL